MRSTPFTSLLLGASFILAELAAASACNPIPVTSTVYASPSSSATPQKQSTLQQKPSTFSTKTAASATRASFTTPSSSPAKGKAASGYRNVIYFTNWGIYDAQTFPNDLPVDKLTHVLYAFGDIDSSGKVITSDSYADVEKQMPGAKKFKGSSKAETANGAVGQFFQIKKKNRNLKLLLSIGGWTYSQDGKFDSPASTDTGRKNFAESAVKLMADYGFDGLDIDWEYPKDKSQGEDFVALLRACRMALDDYAKRNKQDYHYELTVAASAGASHYDLQDLKSMDLYLDAWHLMTYDYAGTWDTTTGHQANVFKDTVNKDASKFDSDSAIKDYVSKGVALDKIVFGLPLYGRAFGNAEGIGKPFSGPGKGPLESGMWLYKDLPRPGAKTTFDSKTGATYSYDSSTKELVSYDGPESAKFKADYIMDKGLGGSFFWDATGDKKGDDSLVNILAKKFEGKLLKKQNMLSYPESRYTNIKNGQK